MSLPVPRPLFNAGLRPFAKLVFPPAASWGTQRFRMRLLLAWPGTPRDVTVETIEFAGRPAELLTPAGVEPGRVLLYLHGGGYCVGSPRTHRAVVGRLATQLRAVAYVTDYRLAPEHPFPAAFDDTLAAYQALLEAGWAAEQIFVAGDSAGGGLTLALGIAAVQRALPLPAALGLLCPGIDFTPAALGLLPKDGREPALTPALMARFGRTYLGDADRADPRISSLLADLTGLPPLVIDTAEYDILLSQSRRLAACATEAGVHVRYREHGGLGHAFQCAAGLLRHADLAVDALAADLLAAAHRSARGGRAHPETA
ncbi:MAG: bah 1 [Nocardia sp.]|uniref:alpha/beta hydrolase n=1 Tax=Nocardia sp. TaxID=1821 RepID=UPI002603F510|nr:alpha/beta hydrolase [Nocardia sp.]MCU1646258.1 bah 1 [Nocardia sp.]